jgi:hypothetical protein
LQRYTSPGPHKTNEVVLLVPLIGDCAALVGVIRKNERTATPANGKPLSIEFIFRFHLHASTASNGGAGDLQG